MRLPLSVAAIVAFLLVTGAAPVGAQGPDGPLTYLTTDFVTGDVVVGGTSLYRAGVNGFATKNILISGVPVGAEILSAYLYVQTTVRESFGEDAGIAGAKFKGHSLNLPGGPVAKALNWTAGTQACWSYGWNPRRRLVTYRADVLRFLAIDPITGKHVANGPHSVQVADAGRGSIRRDDDEDPPTMAGPRAVGASLVLIYRHPDPLTPLRAIVIYDGGVTKRSLETMTQRIQGFYQPTADPGAKMIHIVGDGQPFFSEKVQLGAQISLNPFIGANGLRWDNTTFNLAPTTLKTYPELNTLTVSRHGFIPDCLSWSAIIVSTKVQDTDNDGLLDIWESLSTPIFDPDGQELPNLQAMGADPTVKDLFFEIGYLHTPGYTGDISADPSVSYGGIPKPGHSHMPSEEALNIVGDAFLTAPVTNPDGSAGPGPIKVHFDVGDNYQSSPYVIPTSLALGGQGISETMACPDGDSIIECPGGLMPGQYPLHPGTVGWKTGYRFYRDEILGFDPGRKGIFRYVLSAHSLGLPLSEFPCLDASSVPVPYTNGVCAVGTVDNPDFHKPKTNSGVADWAGADIMVLLGGFDDSLGRPVGTDYMWAATLSHESGHTMGRRHGGDLFEPNCKPHYLSVMNYLYQLRGLPDLLGVPQLDFSRGFAPPQPLLSELALSDDFQSDVVPYRIGWYAPKATSYLNNQIGGAATKHCDGSPLLTDQLGNPTEPLMVRLDATQVGGLIDWNADGLATFGGIQDINFDGFPQTALSPSTSDWAQFRMNQLGARRSVGGLFLDILGKPTVGPMSLNAGKGDLGKGDLGKGDLGKGDLGKGDLGKGDLGKGDLGKGDLGIGLDLGKGDLGKGDLGGGDLDVGGPGEPEAEIDVPTAAAVTGGNPTPPSALAACLTGDGACAGDGDRPVRLDWLTPNVGQPLRYLVYRFVVDPEQPFPPEVLPAEDDEIDTVYGPEGGGPPPTTYLDSNAPAGKNLAYFLRAVFFDDEQDEEVTSGISNFATITTPTPPIVDPPPPPVPVPVKLGFVTQPTQAVPGGTIAPPVQVAIQDGSGVTVPGSTLPVTLAIGSNPGEGTLSGTTTQEAVNGIATFPNLAINNAGTGYTLVASSGNLAQATSATFDIIEPDFEGTDFWLAFPGNAFCCGTPTLSLFITGDTNTTGTVDVPGIAFSTVFSVTAGTVTTVGIPVAAHLTTSDGVEAKGIHVTAMDDVTVYGLNQIPFTTDAYLGLPTDTLGTEYIVLGYKNSDVINASEFAVVGTVDGTNVTITPSVTTGLHVAGLPYIVTLNQGQTYQLINTNAAPADLSGTIVTSTAPIAVFGGHNCANIPPGSVACDHVIEQLPPTSAWGTNFVTVPLATRTGGDTFRFIASTDGTTVTVNGGAVIPLNRGQLHEQIIIGPAQIASNLPIMVAQYSNGTSFDGVTSDPFMMLVPPFDQFLPSYTVTTPASGFIANFINVIAPNAAVGLVALDGSPIPVTSFTPIGTSGFSGAQISVGLGSHNLTGPLPFGVFVYGFNSADSYGYPGGMRLAPIAP